MISRPFLTPAQPVGPSGEDAWLRGFHSTSNVEPFHKAERRKVRQLPPGRGQEILTNSIATMADDESIFGTILPSREGYPAPELGLTMSIVLTGRRWRSLLDDKLRELGHSASRMEAMSAIAYAPPHTTQIQIAKRVGIEGPTLTRTLDMLEADGLVERLPDPSDRRNKHMKLTNAGFTALGEMLAVTGALRSKLLEGIPMTEIRSNLGFLSLLMERIDDGLSLDED